MRAILLGGDKRLIFACDCLQQSGVVALAYPQFELNDLCRDGEVGDTVIVLPVPVSRDGVRLNMDTSNYAPINLIDLFARFEGCKAVFGGGFPNEIKWYCEKHSINCIDFFDIESFQIENAFISAEGAIHYAQSRFNRSLLDASVAIFGFGRLGKMLEHILRSYGADVRVIARRDSDPLRSALTKTRLIKVENSRELDEYENDRAFDIVFNTVPARIISEKFILKYAIDSLIIDLASHPFGIDGEIVKKHSLNYHIESGIPGRFAPKSSGGAIARTLLSYI